MDILNSIKAVAAEADRRFNAIQSPAARVAVAVFAALLVLMIVWAILPWIGVVFAIAAVAAVALFVLPKIKSDQ